MSALLPGTRVRLRPGVVLETTLGAGVRGVVSGYLTDGQRVEDDLIVEIGRGVSIVGADAADWELEAEPSDFMRRRG